MSLFNKTDIKQLVILFFASLIVSFPYFFYSPRQALMAVLVLMIFAWVSKFIYFVVSIYSLLLNTFFLHLVTKWGANSLVSRIQVSFESATYERWEYFKTFFSTVDILLMLVYVLVSLFIIFYILKNNTISTFVRKIMLLVSILLVVISLLIFPTIQTLKNFQLVHLPLSVYSTYNDLKIINKRVEFLKTIDKTKINCPNPFDKIIVIQGESVNKDHMSLYGYERKTTPFFDTIKPYKFEAISPTNQTRLSIPIQLTEASVNNFQKFYQSKSIISLLAACGYKTYWISNQGKTGEYETTITSIANEAEHAFFLNDLDYTTAGLDENILKKLDTIDTNGPDKQAFFIHLLGSHISYSERYSSNRVFSNEEDIITQYDNSIYYTDYIISEIYKRFDNNHSLYFYLSDHGEVVEAEKQGHGYSPSFKEEYEIPFVIWSKDHSKISELHESAQGKTINAESLSTIIEYLVGIDDSLDITYSNKVISVQPDNILDYSQLQRHSQK